MGRQRNVGHGRTAEEGVISDAVVAATSSQFSESVILNLFLDGCISMCRIWRTPIATNCGRRIAAGVAVTRRAICGNDSV